MKFVENDFHARFSALSRSYRYIIFNNKVKPCINRNKVGWYFLNILDEKKMQIAGKNFWEKKIFLVLGQRIVNQIHQSDR